MSPESKPKLFVASSVEGLPLAKAVQANLWREVEVTVWNQGVFELSRSTLDSLLSALPDFDFAVFVFSPDDVLQIRGTTSDAVRDNVIFELGLFVSSLGKERCFILQPEPSDSLRIPSDLIGVSPTFYEANRSDGNNEAATGPSSQQIAGAVRKLGPRRRAPSAAEGTTPPTAPPSVEGMQDQVHESIRPSRHSDAAPTSDEPPATSAPPVEPQPWVKAIVAGDRRRAVEELDQVILSEEDEEKKREAMWFRAIVLFGLSVPEGEASFNELFRLYPTHTEYRQNLASHLIDKGFASRALHVVEEGIQAVPNDSKLVLARADALTALGRIDEAEAILAEQLAASHSAEAALRLSELRRRQVGLAQAVEVIDQALEESPYSTQLLARKAELLFELQRFAESALVYRQLATLEPDEPTHYSLLGNVLLELGLNNLAMGAYREGVKRSQLGQPWIEANIGNLYNNLGLFDDAIEFLERALSKEPQLLYAQQRLLSAKLNRDAQSEKLRLLEEQASQSPSSE